jgi:hypothetical protein
MLNKDMEGATENATRTLLACFHASPLYLTRSRVKCLESFICLSPRELFINPHNLQLSCMPFAEKPNINCHSTMQIQC